MEEEKSSTQLKKSAIILSSVVAVILLIVGVFGASYLKKSQTLKKVVEKMSTYTTLK